ncbi:VOC family protein [uncultured Roseobacter sp.]|uniref:VOC family protein n=1 Tax=uncultured Roseobacter sp. TaxID=114847 RepID=UPI0026178EDA|nr:VOC family protein [uncultured Roseobacter sp.]
MLKLDHITVIAPSLAEGAGHVSACLDLDVPFGTRHIYMGTHNHRLQLGRGVYLEIVALDPDGVDPAQARWFGLDNQQKVRADWDAGRRLRGWVANTVEMDRILSDHQQTFGIPALLPPDAPEFAFAIPKDGSLPLDGAAPSLIDHRGVPTRMDEIPQMGARLDSLTLEHPTPETIKALYAKLGIDRPPKIVKGPQVRYTAHVETPNGRRVLT